VLLLDEPFNALDAKLRLSMQVELRKLISRVGITSIFVTHDQAEAMTLSDQVAVMREGRIEQVAPPLEIYDRPATPYVATFIGRANVVPVTVRAGTVEQLPGLATARPDGPAALVLRPENLRIAEDGLGWSGQVLFATADGPTMELELDAGLGEPLRAVLPRRAGEAAPAPGMRLRLAIANPEGCPVIAADGR
jgi:ABC-type Fe3+/spermidine/putrescine transport system ATPase subunit